MTERGGPGLEDIAKAAGLRTTEQDIALEASSSKAQGLPEPLPRILTRQDSEEYHKHKESLPERPAQVAFAEGQESPGLAHSAAMPTGGVGGSSITSDPGPAANQTQVQTPASDVTNTPTESADQRLEEQATIIQSPTHSGSGLAAPANQSASQQAPSAQSDHAIETGAAQDEEYDLYQGMSQ